jgi:mRNA-degrading endonuclease RelE of RelBE toxin-antitoxin system
MVLKLKDYDVKKMTGEPGIYRVRMGKIRVIFRKEEKSAIVISIDYRGGAY